MQLKDIPKGSKLDLHTEDHEGEVYMHTFIFSHLDGMYSYIYQEDKPSAVVHLRWDTPLELLPNGHYKLAE